MQRFLKWASIMKTLVHLFTFQYFVLSNEYSCEIFILYKVTVVENSCRSQLGELYNSHETDMRCQTFIPWTIISEHHMTTKYTEEMCYTCWYHKHTLHRVVHKNKPQNFCHNCNKKWPVY